MVKQVPDARAAAAQGGLRRTLRARHLAMIAVGGAMGTGLFVGSGKSVSTAGPGGAVCAYLLVGVMVYFVMTSLGEMATALPVSGAWNAYATRFVDPALGFAVGWNSWFSDVITIPVEISAANILLKYWFPHISTLLTSAIFLILLLVLNVVSARWYGEGEFWFAGIKVMACLVFLVVGVAGIAGVAGGHPIGLENWQIGQAPFVGGVGGLVSVFVVAGFAFQGAEYVGIAAGESVDPEKSVPKAIGTVFWRIAICYVGVIVVVAWSIPYTDPELLSASVNDVALSPFTLLLHRAGLGVAAGVMNAVLLTCVLSAGNSMMYVSSRMLYAMARDCKAPEVFGIAGSRGIPLPAVCLSAAIGAISLLTSSFGNSVFLWLLELSGLTGFLKWASIALSHYRFRRAWLAQGRDPAQLVYRAAWFPLGPLLAGGACVVAVLGQGYSGTSWPSAATAYGGIVVFGLLWLGYKLVRRTQVVPLRAVSFDIRPDNVA